ncbi:MAG: sigma-54-dependent Fis family transcriptional regulator [Deltaproteobacteria bacterium]|nr:sigma-54-dependent Fis family transcriptional regulator [Deltaproteobacteria bacterium]
MAESIALLLARAGFKCTASCEPVRTLDLISESRPDLVVSGLRMPVMNGMEVLDLIKKEHATLPVIIVTGYATVDAAVEAMKKGAADFVSKPFHSDELIIKIRKALNHVRVLDENRYLRQELQVSSSFPNMIGNSLSMRKIFDTLERLKESECRVLVTGESGTGKEVVSRAIHRLSPRRDEKFFAINCAALTETLLESELFGHERGAFTGAIASKMGLFELANRGTLYLDEIAETSQAFQAKLLRAVEHNEFQRVGGTKTLKTDVRIIACTNRNLEKEIAKGSFRQDLFYRLCVVHIHIPPLRDRKDDIPLLVEYFVKRLSLKMGKKIEGVSRHAMDAMTAYPWPGNIRELENALERGMIMASGPVIRPEDLPLAAAAGAENDGLTTLEELEKKLIERTLAECNWNKSLAAKKIGIGRRTLYDKAVRLGIPLKPNGD